MGSFNQLKMQFMKKSLMYSLLAMSIVLMNSCTVIGDIFKAGAWVGIIAVVVVIAVIVFVINMFSKKS